MRRIASFGCLVLCLACASRAWAADAERIDRLFAKWDHDSTPGGVVAVLKDGAVVHRRAFGLANLDDSVPNTPQTLFHIASVSKQFTAFAVLLLEQDGKLSLDDDVRRHVPEVPDFGRPITIRHLLHHTSGLRDQPHLMWMAGYRFEDEATTEDVLRLVSRQRRLNFWPGDQTTYSNTGYTLLGVIVERVAGQSLAAFTKQRILEPLGMSHTLVQNDHHQVVKGRAASYRPARGGGYEGMSLSDSTVGQTGIVTTVDDLALWDRNFEDGKVGGKALVERMLECGRLNNGERTRYAAGLGVDEYRGLRLVQHSGSIAGYRCHYLRFPEQRTAVIVLGNTEDLPATDLAHQVADIYLEDRLAPRPATADAKPATEQSKTLDVPPELLDAYAGDYQIGPGDYVTISRDGDHLTAQGTGSGRVTLTPESHTSFLLPRKGAGVAFVKGDGAAQAEAVRILLNGKERLAKRIPAAPLSDFTGNYYSRELGVVYEVTSRDGKLYLGHPRGEIEMKRTVPDTFEVPFPLKSARFERNPAGRCTHLLIDAERVSQVRFDRVELGG